MRETFCGAGDAEFHAAMKSGGAGWPRRSLHDRCLLLCSYRLFVIRTIVTAVGLTATAVRLSAAVGLATGAVRLPAAARC